MLRSTITWAICRCDSRFVKDCNISRQIVGCATPTPSWLGSRVNETHVL